MSSNCCAWMKARLSETNGRKQRKGAQPITVWLANLLQKKLDVKPSRESNVINTGYTGNDPTFAAAVANAFAQAYIDVNLELKIEPARQNAAGMVRRPDQTTGQARRPESASSYQQETGIVATDERLDYETAQRASTQLTIVQGQTVDSRSKTQSAAGSGTCRSPAEPANQQP